MIILNIYFYLMYMSILIACMYMYMCMSDAQRSKEGIVSPRNVNAGSCELRCGFKELNSDFYKSNKCS